MAMLAFLYCLLCIGFPDRVENIRSSSSNCSIIELVWDSANVQPGFNLTYCVMVYNITGSQPSDVMGRNDVCMLTDTHFTFTASCSDIPAHPFGFIVTAVSDLGRGPPSQMVNASFSPGRISCSY